MALRRVIGSLCTLVAVAGCSLPAPPAPPAPVSTLSVAPPSAAVTRLVDLSRLAEIKDEFPPGYVPYPLNGPRKLASPKSERVGDFVSYGSPLTASPESCRALLQPVAAQDGGDEVSIASGAKPEDPFVAVSVFDPVSVPVGIPDSGCDRFTFVVDGGGASNGRAERLDGPSLDGALTYGLKVVFRVGDSSVEMPLVEYFYTAILDGRTFVNLWARVPARFAAEPVLPDLLTKAVTAIRGR